MALMSVTTSRVDALPFFKTVISVPRTPSWRTILVCGESRRGRGRRRECRWSCRWVLTGKSFSSATVCGLAFSSTYIPAPRFRVPEGRIRFCALIALTTSTGVRPLACSAAVSRSTKISRNLPP